MKSHKAKKRKRSTLIKIGLSILLLALAWFNRDSIISFVRFASDRQAVIDYMESLGAVGPLVLMGLIAAPVLIPSIPPEPPMIAGAYIYGFHWALLINWLGSVAASLLVFYLTRSAGKPFARWLKSIETLGKWIAKAEEKGAIFYMLAFINPLVPSDIMTYVAGLTTIPGMRFFWATLIGRLPMVLLLTLVGANGFVITPAMIGGLIIFGLIMLVVWWHLFIRDKPEIKLTAIKQP